LAITRDENRLVRCSVVLQGEYAGVTDLSCGTPVVLGCQGVKEIVEYPMSPEEFSLFQRSVDSLKDERALIQTYLDASIAMGPVEMVSGGVGNAKV
jgi:malate dehydrogenase